MRRPHVALRERLGRRQSHGLGGLGGGGGGGGGVGRVRRDPARARRLGLERGALVLERVHLLLGQRRPGAAAAAGRDHEGVVDGEAPLPVARGRKLALSAARRRRVELAALHGVQRALAPQLKAVLLLERVRRDRGAAEGHLSRGATLSSGLVEISGPTSL